MFHIYSQVTQKYTKGKSSDPPSQCRIIAQVTLVSPLPSHLHADVIERVARNIQSGRMNGRGGIRRVPWKQDSENASSGQ